MSQLLDPCSDALPPEDSPTIEDALQAFLKTPFLFGAKVKAVERETAIELLASYVYYHGHKSLPPAGCRQLDQSFQKTTTAQLGFHQVFGPEKLPHLLPGFLTFLTYEIMPVASQKFVQSTAWTIEELFLWLIRAGHIGAEEGEEAAYRSSEAARNLPRAMRALKRLVTEAQVNSAEEIRWTTEGQSERYTIVRLASNMLWLQNPDGESAGPIKINEKIKRDLEIGWEMRGILVKLHGTWKIVGLGGIFPGPG